ncbi:MAG: cache domain-containing protein, partial [Desulfatitalea sp.]|nr:cache domain-containing protein [Desulfatitalea sp.]
KSSATASIKGYLHATSEKSRQIVSHYYQKQLAGELTEVEAKRQAKEILLSQSIGISGYIYCLNSEGVVLVHPDAAMGNVNVSEYDFVQKQITSKEGYIEYEWRNPGETLMRPKALHMTYFAPWDWIISASSYRNEFYSFVYVDNFRDSILDVSFGRSGYSFVVDTDGVAVIHPKLRNVNLLQSQDLPAHSVQQILDQKSGKLLYSWQNPGENQPRKKLVIFEYLPEFEWVVASSSYLEEFYAPLKTIRTMILATATSTLMLLLPISYAISISLLKPAQELMAKFNQVTTEKDFSVRMQCRQTGDELGQLAAYFNSFMDQLESYSNNLQEQIREHQETKEALQESEERYHSVMEAAPDPMVVYNRVGEVMYMNPAFTKVFGWTLRESLGRKMDHFVPGDRWEETRRMIDWMISGNNISGVETQRFNKTGRIVQVSISGARIHKRCGELLGFVSILRDITEARRLEKEVLDIGDRERQRIGQDLHDDLCAHLIGVESLSHVLENKLTDQTHEASVLAHRIVPLIREAIYKARALARGLCPVHLISNGIHSALVEMARNVRELSKVPCTFSGDESILIDDHALAMHFYYIAQEAVQNAIKHAEARHIRIAMSRAPMTIYLRISDDGKGIRDTPPSKGMGLHIMRYRARMIGATLEIKSAPGKGTEISLSMRTGTIKESHSVNSVPSGEWIAEHI